MPRQPVCPGLRHAMKKTRTRRETFRAGMEAVVPWTRLLALIAPHYPKAGPKGGRPPMSREMRLRIYFLQQWYALERPDGRGDALRQRRHAALRGHRARL